MGPRTPLVFPGGDAELNPKGVCVVALLRSIRGPVPQNHRAEQRLLMARHAAHPRRATAATAITGMWAQTGQARSGVRWCGYGVRIP